MWFNAVGASYLNDADLSKAAVPADKKDFDLGLPIYIITKVSNDLQYIVDKKAQGSGLATWKAIVDHFKK